MANALQRVVYSQTPAEAERLSHDDKILLDSDEEMRVVFVTEISGIGAEGNYTRVQLADGSSSFVRRGITRWEFMLPKPFRQGGEVADPPPPGREEGRRAGWR